MDETVVNKVITMCDSRYFEYGDMFLKTRKKIDAKFICYSPDLTKKQIDTLKAHDIHHKKCDRKCFDEKMQYLKFYFAEKEISCKDNSLITFCDWDTFFIKDWSDQVCNSISLGITYRTDLIQKKCYRAFSNGGVIFFRNTDQSKKICENAMLTMSNGVNSDLPEYDIIWKTLEDTKRKASKRHFRTQLRWWVDQVFLSAMVYRLLRGIAHNETNLCDRILNYQGIKIGFYDCKKFNVLESGHDEVGDVYIRHLKTKSGASAKLKG